jgi:hypothetical protein
MAGTADAPSIAAAQADPATGEYIIASSAPDSISLAMPSEQYSRFTGALIKAVEGGIAQAAQDLTLDDLFSHVRSNTEPKPRKRVTDFPSPFVVCSNAKAAAQMRSRNAIAAAEERRQQAAAARAAEERRQQAAAARAAEERRQQAAARAIQEHAQQEATAWPAQEHTHQEAPWIHAVRASDLLNFHLFTILGVVALGLFFLIVSIF